MSSVMIKQIVSFFVSLVVALLPMTSSGSKDLLPAPAPPRYTQTADKKTQELKIMTFNVLITGEGDVSPENRLNGVVQTILAEMPDSFGLQEAGEFWRSNLRSKLLKYYYIAGDYGRQLGFSEGSPIFYRKDKFWCLGQGVFWLSDTPKVYSMGWDASVTRMAAWVKLRDKKTGFTYVHYNAHFDHIGPVAKANSAVVMANWINEKDQPTVVTGDFNATPGSPMYNNFKAGGFLDARLLAATADKGLTAHNYKGGASGNPIDYVLANHYLRSVSSYRIIRQKYDGHYPSDHFAVVSVLTLAN